MDFRQTSQPSSTRPTVLNPTPVTPEHKEKEKPEKGSKRAGQGKLMRVIYLLLLVGIAILLLCIAFGVGRNNTRNESELVDANKYQAVFLNNGQVYFGDIQDLNNDYVRMTNIYYLTQTGDTTNSNYSLVKLGCQQIHDPLDEMVISRSKVTFWQNLNDDGKVVKSIQEFQKQNPNGPDCTQVSTDTQASPNSTQNSQNSSNTGTTGTNGSTSGDSTTKK
jgi:hypothetical protein